MYEEKLDHTNGPNRGKTAIAVKKTISMGSTNRQKCTYEMLSERRKKVFCQHSITIYNVCRDLTSDHKIILSNIRRL